MTELKKIKYILAVSAFILLLSNLVAIRAIVLYEKPVAASEPDESEKYREMCEELSKENKILKERLKELEKPAEKWNIFENRYSKSSRSGYDTDFHQGIKATHKRMRVTAYTEYECDKDPEHPLFRITSSGNEVEEWFTVAAGPEIPFGTRIYIPYFRDFENKGIFVVEDRGGAIKTNCLDVYIPDQKAVDEFGVKWLDVYIIEEAAE